MFCFVGIAEKVKLDEPQATLNVFPLWQDKTKKADRQRHNFKTNVCVCLICLALPRGTAPLYFERETQRWMWSNVVELKLKNNPAVKYGNLSNWEAIGFGLLLSFWEFLHLRSLICSVQWMSYYFAFFAFGSLWFHAGKISVEPKYINNSMWELSVCSLVRNLAGRVSRVCFSSRITFQYCTSRIGLSI